MAKQDDFDYQILKLSDNFYRSYPNPPYSEILKKQHRAYDCLLIQTHYDYFMCIPYRSEITHPYAYHFKNSVRSRRHRSGLDYSKLVIIRNPEYIEKEDAVIDRDEYIETVRNINKIEKEALEFVESYCGHMNGEKRMHEKEFGRRYRFSPLKYFHKELNLKVVHSQNLC